MLCLIAFFPLFSLVQGSNHTRRFYETCQSVCLDVIANTSLPYFISTPLHSHQIRKNSLHSSGTHFPTVDIFFLFMYRESALYIHRGHFWFLPKAIMQLSRRPKSRNSSEEGSLNLHDCRVHIISDSEKIVDKGKELGFFTYDIRKYQVFAYLNDLW